MSRWLFHVLFRRHRWHTTQRGLYGEMQRCACGADRVEWSYYFTQKHA